MFSSRWDKKYILHGTHFHAPGFEATWALNMHQEKKNLMVNFLIFVHKNVYRIRFQEIKIGPWEGFEKKAFFSLFLMRKRLSGGQKWFLRPYFPLMRGKFHHSERSTQQFAHIKPWGTWHELMSGQDITLQNDRISGFWKHHLYNLWVFIYLKWWFERPISTSYSVKATFPLDSNDRIP